MSTSRPNGNERPSAQPRQEADGPAPEPIAIVGIGCRFPGRANDPDAFWRILEQGVDAVTDLPADRWNLDTFFSPDSSKPGKSYSRWGGFVDGIDRFDPHFFGISPREAARMDPQQRMLLEVAWEGLEDAGLPIEPLAGSQTSVFVGISSFDYSIAETSFRDRGAIDVYSNTGGSLSIAANRISYCFDFRGPSMIVDTACSSALVAVHHACRSIWRDGCSLALAGGVNALLLPDWYVGFCRMGMLSPEGRCRAFDARASGFVRSEGAGIVVLKPLAQALADGNRIYAVVRGSAVNQDGRTPGMTVPSEDAQAALLREACRTAGVSPLQIQYVEAHGTGTLVGDPIEARALGKVLAPGRSPEAPCLIGSVKTNIGHLEAGAGIAGLIKVALALHHRRLPGNLHFEHPNPEIDFDALRLRVPTRTEPWPNRHETPVAGVNAFGFGGTNAHVLLAGAPGPILDRSAASTPANLAVADDRAWLVPISARSADALRDAARAMADFVDQDFDETPLRVLAANAAFRRSHHEHRLAIVASSRAELAAKLRDSANGQTAAGVARGRATPSVHPRVAFVCSGQGPQWWAMGRELLRDEPVFRDVLEHADEIVRSLGSWSLLDELRADEANSWMEQTAIAQPCLFAIQVGLAKLWDTWGVRPESLVGHSVGEVAAAYLAGVLSFEDAVRVIYHRGRCMDLAPERGRMLAAAITVDEAQSLIAPLGNRVSIAAANGPASVTLSGDAAPLEAIAAQLESRGLFHRFLRVQYAFHSAQMDPIRDGLLEALAGIRPQPARLPLFSTVTGRRVLGPELGPEYWWRNVRQTVRFADGVDRLIEREADTIVELSPHPVLAAAVTECYQHRGKKVTVLQSLRRQAPERATMLRSLGELHGLGHPIDWAGVMPGREPFHRLPLYPWQRERCWHEAEESRISRLTAPDHPLLGVSQGTPQPSWEARLDIRLSPFLTDHRVQGRIILPATAYLELAFAAAQTLHGANGCELRDVKLANPCFLSADEPRRVRTALDADAATLRIHTSRIAGDAEWVSHLVASVRPLRADSRAVEFSTEAVRDRCTREFSREQSYEYLETIGLNYGPMFQGIERIWQGEREALGWVRLPEAVGSDGEFLFHPALLDACFQVVVSADADFRQRNGGLYLPCEVEKLQLHRPPGREVWVHARLIEKTSRQSLAELDVYDTEGRLCASIRGLLSRRVAGAQDESLDDLYYAYQWTTQSTPAPVPLDAPGRWLIFSDRGGLGERLADQLVTGDDTCTVVAPTETSNTSDSLEQFLRSSRDAIRGVIHLRSLDAPSTDTLEAQALHDAQGAVFFSVVDIVKAWEQHASDQAAPLLLVTRGAQPVGPSREPIAVAQSPLIGLGRVISGEYARLKCRLVDLDSSAVDGGLQTLFQEVQIADDEDEVAWRGSERHTRRYLPSPSAPPTESGLANVPYRLAIRRPGTLDGLVLQTQARRPPGLGEVEIEVVAAGLNFSDVMKALGIYPGLADGPVPLGAECSGRITAIGEGVTHVAVGDEVMAVAPSAFSSHVVTRAELVAHKPSRLTFEEAASLPIAFLTAAYALEDLGRIAPGESVLVHSASGGVGLAAIQLARRAGATVFATAGNAEKRAYLEALGITEVMDSRSLEFGDQVRERTGGRGVDLVLNSLPGAAIGTGIAALADYGRFLEIGKQDIYQNASLALQPFRKNLSFFAIDLDRVIRERPKALGTLLRDLEKRVQDGEIDPIPVRAWPVTEAAEAFRFMQHAKHIGKVVLTMPASVSSITPADNEPIAFRADGSYLITGGLGGFGFAVARWMAAKGAGTLVLVGRRGPDSPNARQAIAEIERLGARVIVRAADITNQEQLAGVLASFGNELPPLRGVIHAAMVLEDALLVNLDHETAERVLAPKVEGTWNLHTQTAGHSLDFFVMFSSLSSVFGHAGQGSYAAANAFLDAMAWHRRELGLPALTVNWGYLGEVGYLAQRAELGERLERQGVLSISLPQALGALEKAIQRTYTQVSVMRLDRSRWRGLSVTGRVSPRFAHLCKADRTDESQAHLSDAPIYETLCDASPEARRGMLQTVLRERVARVLGIVPERIDVDRPLLQIGLDSLMAVELRNWIESDLQINLPIVELMRSPSIMKLADLLADEIVADHEAATPTAGRGATVSESRPVRAPSPELEPQELLANVDNLSSEEVDALLLSLLESRVDRARR